MQTVFVELRNLQNLFNIMPMYQNRNEALPNGLKMVQRIPPPESGPNFRC